MDQPAGSLPQEGAQVVLFNQNAQGVLAQQNDNTDSPAINSVSAQITDGKAIPENGGVVFTVERSGEYYRFRNETYGYLCSNGTGNNAFYSQTASEEDVYPPQKAPAAPTVSSRSLFACTWRRLSPEASPIKR